MEVVEAEVAVVAVGVGVDVEMAEWISHLFLFDDIQINVFSLALCGSFTLWPRVSMRLNHPITRAIVYYVLYLVNYPLPVHVFLQKLAYHE
jgi:hypothetical protein